MTKIKFSNSIAAAIEFTIKFLSGTLNIRADHDASQSSCIEVNYTDNHFTTEGLARLKYQISKFKLSRLEASDFLTDANSSEFLNELRHVTVFGTTVYSNEDICVVKFDVYRECLDGENGEGWTRWNIKNVVFFLDGVSIKIHRAHFNDGDSTPIWGTDL
jgi:hypothetical protein